MQSMKKQRNNDRSPRKNIGFYISLAICITAVGAAAWTTYAGIEENNSTVQEESVQESQHTEVNDELSGQTYERSEPLPESSTAPKEESRTEEKTKAQTKKTSVIAEGSKAAPVIKEQSSAPEKNSTIISFPVENGRIVKPFSPKNPLRSLTMNDWRTHSGTDISASAGASVRAIMAGKVSRVYDDPLLGKVIEISHTGGYTARYCGISDNPVVKAGSNVRAGDTIGYLGTIPSECKDKPHLHLEIKYDKSFFDPALILKNMKS